MFKTKYRIVKINFRVFEVQVKYWWSWVWVAMPGTSIYFHVDDALSAMNYKGPQVICYVKKDNCFKRED